MLASSQRRGRAEPVRTGAEIKPTPVRVLRPRKMEYVKRGRYVQRIMLSGVSAMTAAQYSLLAALVFALVAVLQIVRAVAGLPVTIGEHSIPVWAGWVAGGVATILAWLGYTSSKR